MPFNRAYCSVVLIVTLAHAALLWQAATPALRMPAGKPDGRPMNVRVLTGSPERGLGFDREAYRPPVSVSPVEAYQSVGFEAASESKAARSPLQPPQLKEQPGPAIAGLPAPSKGQASSDDAGEAAFLDYLPRSLLSAPAQPLTSIQVRFPDAVSGLVDLKVQATLFIDENGTVRRARVDSPAVPGEFIQAVFDTFLPAQFKPGQVETVAVRSQLRIEVEFRATR